MTIFSTSTDVLDLTLLLLPESSMLSLAATLDPLRAANRLAHRAVFRWRIVTPNGAPALLTCGVPVAADGRLDEVRASDAVIVIGGFNQARHAGRETIGVLRRLAQTAGGVGGIEAGSWLLARAGLLDGRRATTHWEDLEDFALAFPRVEVSHERFVLSGPFFTAGGASPSMDMILHLIRCRLGLPMAIQVASVFLYEEMHPGSDLQPQVSLGRLGRLEPRVSRAVRLMEQNLDAPLPAAVVAAAVGVSARHLQGLFKRELGVSPSRYHTELRLQLACRLLLDGSQSVQAISVRTGFSSQSVFSRAFRQCFGVSPRVFRNRGRAR